MTCSAPLSLPALSDGELLVDEAPLALPSPLIMMCTCMAIPLQFNTAKRPSNVIGVAVMFVTVSQ